MRHVALTCLLLASAATMASAQTVPPQNSRPSETPKVDTIPPPRDIPYPGTIQLTVDASDVTRGIFRIHERVPVTNAGDVVMLYPKWIPGGHTPRGDVKNITGFRPSANGQALDWVRDDLDVWAFHIKVPAGVTAIDLDYQYVSATDNNQGRIVATPDMASIQ